MTRYSTDPSTFLGDLSRRKLQKVAESSDTLRRCVLIHNVMRSTASTSSLPLAPESTHYIDYDEEEEDDNEDEQSAFEEEEEEEDYREASGAENDTAGQNIFVFPQMTSSAQEQDWLDSILDDLEGDVNVSVVPVDYDDPTQESQPGDPHYPLFACAVPPTPSSPIHSPPLRPTSPCCNIPEIYFASESPPASPPGLDSDNMDSDDEDSDSEDFSETPTPSASTEFPIPSNYFLNHLPLNRLRPSHSTHQFEPPH